MASDRAPSRLFMQLAEANVSDEEMLELYEDLKHIFADSSFDAAVAEAVNIRGGHYIEVPEQRPN